MGEVKSGYDSYCKLCVPDPTTSYAHSYSFFPAKFSLDYPPCPTLPYSPAIERLVLHALALNLSGISRLENNEACKTLLAAQSYLAKVFYQIILIPTISNNSGYICKVYLFIAALTLQQLGTIKSKLFSKTSYLIRSGLPHAPGEWS